MPRTLDVGTLNLKSRFRYNNIITNGLRKDLSSLGIFSGLWAFESRSVAEEEYINDHAKHTSCRILVC